MIGRSLQSNLDLEIFTISLYLHFQINISNRMESQSLSAPFKTVDNIAIYKVHPQNRHNFQATNGNQRKYARNNSISVLQRTNSSTRATSNYSNQAKKMKYSRIFSHSLNHGTSFYLHKEIENSKPNDEKKQSKFAMPPLPNPTIFSQLPFLLAPLSLQSLGIFYPLRYYIRFFAYPIQFTY